MKLLKTQIERILKYLFINSRVLYHCATFSTFWFIWLKENFVNDIWYSTHQLKQAVKYFLLFGWNLGILLDMLRQCICHSQFPDTVKEQIKDGGNISVLVATIAAGMGVNFKFLKLPWPCYFRHESEAFMLWHMWYEMWL